LDRLTERTILCARVVGVDLILIWDGERAKACERTCPHEQADLCLGHLSMGRLFCPRHAASFDLADGRISDGWTSPPLRLFPVRIAEDQVWIDAEAVASSTIRKPGAQVGLSYTNPQIDRPM
jgi:3-phenylpropionate/trans-cinnamate dioxygenase ferredoxin component